MKTYIALFRGINVGGKNSLPMKELVAILQELGLQDVATYIQSGNAVFRSGLAASAKLAESISRAIAKCRGFEPCVLLLSADELQQAIDANPFPEAAADPKSLHLGFLASVPKRPDLKKLKSIRAANERFALESRCFYLHAPDGIGRSKLAASAEKLLGVPMTLRNWRTVAKLMEMAGQGS